MAFAQAHGHRQASAPTLPVVAASSSAEMHTLGRYGSSSRSFSIPPGTGTDQVKSQNSLSQNQRVSTLFDDPNSGTKAMFQRATLFFHDATLENKFRVDLFRSWQRIVWRLFVAMAAMLLIGILVDYHYIDITSQDTYIRTKLALWITSASCFAAIALGGSCQRLLFIRLGTDVPAINFWRLFISASFFFLLTASGCVWTIYSVATNDRLMRDTDSTPTIAFLVSVHGLSKMVFPLIVASTWSVVVAHVASAFAFRNTTVDVVQTLEQLSFLLLINLVLCHVTYVTELYRRRSFFLKHMKKERDEFREEAADLKKEYFDLVLRNLDVADFGDMDIKAPLEQAMLILRELTTTQKGQLGHEAYKGIKRVMAMLGSTNDLFRPQFAQELARKKVDNEIQSWLMTLIDDPSSRVGVHRPATLEPAPNTRAVSAPLPVLVDAEQKVMDNLLERIDYWDFDVFELQKVSKGRPLTVMGFALFKRYNLISRFNINPTTLHNFLNNIESGYRDNPYHNSTHACDVVQTVHVFLTQGRLSGHMTEIELLAAVVASAIHDYDHPGRSNAFHVATKDRLAILYNDKSVLENHHSAAAFQQLLKDENNIVANMSSAEFLEFRKLTIEMVLATDLFHHFEYVNQFKNTIGQGENDMTVPKNRLLVLQMALKCADVSHTSKARDLHLNWTKRVCEEFYRQGEEEKARGLPRTPFSDRAKPRVPTSQIGFMNFLVKPMFDAWVAYLNVPEDLVPCARNLLANRDYWMSLQEESEREADQ